MRACAWCVQVGGLAAQEALASQVRGLEEQMAGVTAALERLAGKLE